MMRRKGVPTSYSQLVRKAPIASATAIFTVVIILLAGMAVPSHAQSGRAEFNLFKAGLLVGVSGGQGTLFFQGKSYRFNIGGVTLGGIGISNAKLSGEVYNLTNPADIVGTYTATSAGLAVVSGSKVASLKNSKGVVLKVRGRQAGLRVGIDLSGMSINLE